MHDRRLHNSTNFEFTSNKKWVCIFTKCTSFFFFFFFQLLHVCSNTVNVFGMRIICEILASTQEHSNYHKKWWIHQLCVKLIKNLFIQNILYLTWVTTRSSTLVVGKTTPFCKLYCQETASLAKENKSLVVNFLLSGSSALSICIYLVKISWTPSKPEHRIKILLKYRKIQFMSW